MGTPSQSMDIQFQPMIEFWYKTMCPQCNIENWTYHSHSQRHEPIYSPEICRCHGCGNRYWMMDKDTVDDLYPAESFKLEAGESLMDVCGAFEDEGLKSPR